MRCPRCGNDNPGTNRFCGMCGATLLETPPPTPAPPVQAAATPSPAPATIAPPVPHAPESRPPQTSSREEVLPISGPSFLGLNEPAPTPRPRGSLSIDPQSAPGSGNLDYLLEDEEEPKSGGAGKFILIIAALVLAAGLGYLRWKNHNFGWLTSGPTKPPVTAQDADAPDSAPSSANPATAPAIQPSAPAAQPTTDSSSATTPSPNSATATPSREATPTPDAAPLPATKPTPAADSTAVKTPPPIAKPKLADPNLAPKPHPAPRADLVSEAQKYLYGKGVRQDCDHGLRLLRPAADQSNPKAMIEMGALYSAGLCTPRDLPTSYRWFALALRKDPDNASLQADLQKLWTEMTQPERQLAVKLSQ